MHVTKYAISALALSALFSVASAAQTTEPANAIGCMHMQKKVSAALDANPTSANVDAAKSSAHTGQNLCLIGRYKEGIDGYSKALDMLGASSN
jgi:hypothetical protein